MNNFKLVDSLTAYISGEKVCLCSSSDVNEKKIVKGTEYLKKSLDNPSLSIKLNKALGFSVEIQDKWYEVENLAYNAVYSVLSQSVCDNTKFSSKFEVAIDNHGLVFFVTEYMNEYEEFTNETIRRLNCSSKRRTKNMIAGHRYDNADETYFCLGEFNCHKGQGNSDWLISTQQPKVYLVSTTSKGTKTVSDLLKTKKFGDEIKIIYKGSKSFVDMGEKLKVDVDLKKGLSEKYTTKLLSSADSLKDKLDLLSLDNIKIAESEVEKITDEIIKLGQKNLLIYKNAKYILPEPYEICNEKSINDNITALENLIHRDIKDLNIHASSYYSSLFFAYNIDIKNKLKSIFKSYDPEAETFNSFEAYLKNGANYLKYRNADSNIKLSQRKKTYYYRSGPEKTVTVSDAIKFAELSEVIKEMANNAIKNNGADINSYEIINIGTTVSPVEYTCLKITLDDIIKYKKGISNISENLKSDIMTSNFQNIRIEIDKGEEIQ